MEQVNPADFYEVQTGLIELMDSNLEFWMASTFAIVLAFHFAGDQISRLMKAIVIFVYVTAAILFSVRIASLGNTFGQLNEMLIKGGAEPWPQDDVFVGLILMLRLLLVSVGTIATVWYVIKAGRNMENEA